MKQQNLKYYKKKLSKKGFNELEDSLEDLYEDFDKDSFAGDNFYTDVESNGHAYKLRIGIKSMNLGKSDGIRTIYYAMKEDNEVYMLTIYKKADMDPTTNQLKKVISDIMKEYL